MNLHVTDSGAGVPVVWIHGFPLASEMFRPQLAIQGVRHLMPDLPGFGRTRAAERELSMDDYARFVLAELDRRGIERATFAGMSMGGYVCFAAARLAPERIAGFILIDTRETADTEEARKGRYETIEKVRREGLGPIVDSMLPKMLTRNASPEMVDEVREIMESTSPAGAIAALGAMATRPDSTPLLPSLDIRTLIITGADDPITPPADAKRMAAAIPNAKAVILDDAAHLSNYQQPEAFNRAAFLWLTG
ncbi:MAG TPA: alpha/beta hydrolase [Thermoanaerobaculia bacterium]|jgi:pimeloyl-ACP methyl ester carboxylesterase